MRNRGIIPICLILLFPIFGISNKAYGKMSFQCNYAEKIDQHYDHMEASPSQWKTKTSTVNHKFKIEIDSVEGNSLDRAKIFYSDGPTLWSWTGKCRSTN